MVWLWVRMSGGGAGVTTWEQNLIDFRGKRSEDVKSTPSYSSTYTSWSFNFWTNLKAYTGLTHCQTYYTTLNVANLGFFEDLTDIVILGPTITL